MGKKKRSGHQHIDTEPGAQPGIGEQPLVVDMRAMETLMSDLRGPFAALRHGKPKSLDLAQDLIYEAWENPNDKQRVAMAFEALALSPDCADAYVILAEATPNIAEAMNFYLLGITAGERAIGKKAFKECKGLFWLSLKTRPFMRAKFGLAECLRTMGMLEPAVEQYKELLELNPNDNQGVRELLAPCLLELGRDDELAALLKKYERDRSATWKYSGVILAFRLESDSAGSRQALASAVQSNPHVPAYLLGKKRMPRDLPSHISFGGDDEAAVYAAGNSEAWRRTPGALEWLAARSG